MKHSQRSHLGTCLGLNFWRLQLLSTDILSCWDDRVLSSEDTRYTALRKDTNMLLPWTSNISKVQDEEDVDESHSAIGSKEASKADE